MCKSHTSNFGSMITFTELGFFYANNIMDFNKWKNTIKNEYQLQIYDIHYILKKVFNYTEIEILLKQTISKEEIEELSDILNQIKIGKPINKIFNCQEFYGQEFYIDENVLAPRQETEILVEKVLEKIENKNLKVLDLCCGSGVIGLSIKKYAPQCEVYLSDISNEALNVCKKNAQILNLNVNIMQSDMFKTLPNEKFDIIVSNPPYIKQTDRNNLSKSVLDFDPEIALFGGNDGLKFYEIIKNNIIEFCNKNTTLFLEIGYDISIEVQNLFKNNNIKVIKDYSNIDRVLIIENFKE